jgi:hypothetical protein
VSAVYVVLVDPGIGERALPDGRGGVAIARPGVPFNVDVSVAGEAPGEWETSPVGDIRDVNGHDPGGIACEPLDQPVVVDGVTHAWRIRRLGHGLLAQVGVFRAASDDEVAAVTDEEEWA